MFRRNNHDEYIFVYINFYRDRPVQGNRNNPHLRVHLWPTPWTLRLQLPVQQSVSTTNTVSICILLTPQTDVLDVANEQMHIYLTRCLPTELHRIWLQFSTSMNQSRPIVVTRHMRHGRYAVGYIPLTDLVPVWVHSIHQQASQLMVVLQRVHHKVMILIWIIFRIIIITLDAHGAKGIPGAGNGFFSPIHLSGFFIEAVKSIFSPVF